MACGQCYEGRAGPGRGRAGGGGQSQHSDDTREDVRPKILLGGREIVGAGAVADGGVREREAIGLTP